MFYTTADYPADWPDARIYILSDLHIGLKLINSEYFILVSPVVLFRGLRIKRKW